MISRTTLKTMKVICNKDCIETYFIMDKGHGEESGFIYEVTLQEILAEINRDRSEEWTDYDETDWQEGLEMTDWELIPYYVKGIIYKTDPIRFELIS